MFHSFFQFSSKVQRFIFLFTFFRFYSVVSRDSRVQNLAGSFLFLLIITRSSRLAEIWWSACIAKSQRSLCISFFRTESGSCIYHLFMWSNFNFLHKFQSITLPIYSCLVLYSFCASLLYLLIMWLIVSSLSPHNLDLLFCYILSILALMIDPYGVVLSCYWKSFSSSLKVSLS